ncbi:MAG: hypothetical protein ACYTEL_17695 [Planctomycetota bacterium]|jgi:hypothetical protein
MRSEELDERLKKLLGSVPGPDAERLTGRVMQQLRQELRKEERPLFLKRFFRRLICSNSGVLKVGRSSRLAGAGQGEPFARRYATVLKVTAAVAATVIISVLIFIPDYGASTSMKSSETSPEPARQSDTLPRYVLNDRINGDAKETKPCDILPPLAE